MPGQTGDIAEYSNRDNRQGILVRRQEGPRDPQLSQITWLAAMRTAVKVQLILKIVLIVTDI